MKPVSPDDVIWGHDGKARYGVLLLPFTDTPGDPVVLVCLARRNTKGRLNEMKHAEFSLGDLERLEREIQAAKARLQS